MFLWFEWKPQAFFHFFKMAEKVSPGEFLYISMYSPCDKKSSWRQLQKTNTWITGINCTKSPLSLVWKECIVIFICKCCPDTILHKKNIKVSYREKEEINSMHKIPQYMLFLWNTASENLFDRNISLLCCIS